MVALTAPCSLPSWHRDCHFHDGLCLFFSRKVLLKFYLHEVIHFHLFVPLPGSSKNAKKLKVPHADAESSLNVLGVRPQVHECDCHRKSCLSTMADPKQSCFPQTCAPPPEKYGEPVTERERGGSCGT